MVIYNISTIFLRTPIFSRARNYFLMLQDFEFGPHGRAEYFLNLTSFTPPIHLETGYRMTLNVPETRDKC